MNFERERVVKVSKLVRLKKAINIIWETMIITKEQNVNNSFPYFFIVGAGISTPEIPSARGIIDECKSKLESMYSNENDRKEILDKGNSFPENTSKYYSYWFGTAYKNKIHRQQYLKRIINSSKISTSNLLLAQILNSKKIATTVITPNFDNHLLKSINLMGNYEVFSTNSVSDNMALSPNSSEIQIMHVHGTYQFYDCKNLDSEILEVANQHGIKSTAGTIEEFLKNQVPIVLGYSGWEDDVLMTKLRERLSCTSLPYNLIWFCYSRRDYECLPAWLKDSDDVIFVCSFEFESEDEHDEQEKYLPAEDVLSAMISRFSIEAPYIFSNPIKYYIEVIGGFLPQNIDMFPVNAWKKRLDYFEEQLSELDKQIIELEDAAARKDIQQVTNIIGQINLNYISKEDVVHIMNGLVKPFMLNKNRIDEKDTLINFVEVVIKLIKKKRDELSQKTVFNYIAMIIECISKHKNIIEAENSLRFYDQLLEICADMKSIPYRLAVLGMKAQILECKQKKECLNSIIDEGKDEISDLHVARCVLQAIKILVHENKNTGEDYLDLMESIKNEHKDDRKVLELYYGTCLELCEKESNGLNLNIHGVIEEIEKNNISSKLLLHARKICCEMEGNVAQKIEIAEKAIEDYNLDDINSCVECMDYSFFIREIIIQKINLSQSVEPKYIDEAFNLCYKEHHCGVIFSVVSDTIFQYVESIHSEYEKRMLAERVVDLCENNEMYQELESYLEWYLEFLEEDERKHYLEGHKKYASLISSGEKLSNAVEAYKRNDKDECKKQLLEASEEYDKIFNQKYNPALLNIGFMVRRGEIPEIRTTAMELFDRITWMNNDAFLHINKALVYVQQNDWDEAIDIVSKIKCSLVKAIEWWSLTEIVGIYEKNVVLSLLLVSGQISKIDVDLSEDFWDYCSAEMGAPEKVCSLLDNIKKEKY